MPSRKEIQEEKRRALHRKYAEAVALYAQTDLPMYVIAERCGLRLRLRGHRFSTSCKGKGKRDRKNDGNDLFHSFLLL